MIGLEELIIKENIKCKDLAKEIGVKIQTFWSWLRTNHVPEKHTKYLSDRFCVKQEYINTVINDINTHKPRNRGFNDYKIVGDYVIIFMHNKAGEPFETYIDLEDLNKVKQINRTFYPKYYKNIDGHYAVYMDYRGFDENGKSLSRGVRLHRIVLDCYDPNIHIDHENHNTLDNRKENLRMVKPIKNSANRSGANKNSSTGVRNVNLVNRYGGEQIYLVQIMKNGTSYKEEFSLSQFDQACKFAEAKRIELFGEFAGNGIKEY